MQDPPAAPRPDLEAEWYRRRRAAKADLPLPAEFRLLDDESGFELRFPVAAWPWQKHPHAETAMGGALMAIALFSLLLAGLGGIHALALCLSAVVIGGLPLVLLGSVRRVVAVRPEGVEVSWWPMGLASRKLVAREIRQVFVRRIEPAPDLRLSWDARLIRAEPQPGFELWILRPDGARERLVGSLLNAEHALYLEGWLERRLGIEDAPVAGEYGV